MSIREAAAMMLEQLEASRLEVALVPQRRRTNEGGMIRCAISRNALWYQRFCAAHVSSRVRRNAAVDTRIKRRATVEALRAIVAAPSAAELPQTLYVARLVEVARTMARASIQRRAA